MLQRTQALSVTDELTDLYNRRHFYDVLEAEMARTMRFGHPFTLVLLDLDGFKEYNDKFGHINGDAVLRSLGQTLNSTLRRSDHEKSWNPTYANAIYQLKYTYTIQWLMMICMNSFVRC